MFRLSQNLQRSMLLAGTVLLRNSNSQAGPETIDSLGCLPDQAIRITALCSTSPDASAHALQVQYQPVKGQSVKLCHA